MLEFFRKKSVTVTELRAILAAARIPLDGCSEVFGPVVAEQFDHSGLRVIQRYVTVLVRRSGEPTSWFMLRQVTEFTNGWECASPPFVRSLNAESAAHWFHEHKVGPQPWIQL